VGAEGTGKTTTAVEFAKAVNCKRRTPEGDACDSCINCTRIAANEHPDVTRIAPDGEFTRIWQLWSRPGHPPGAMETLSFAPVAAPKRFYIFEKAETLNEESANSLLKALEEPPPYVQFVLCAPSPTAVLPTILSRCQMLRFRQAPTEVIAQTLVERRSLPLTEARVLAAYSQGAPGRAFRLADAPELREQREGLLDLAERIAASPGIAAFKLAEDLRIAAKPGKAKKGEEAEGDSDRTARGDLGRAVDVLAAWHSDLLAVALRGPEAPVVHEDRRASLIAAAAKYRPEQLAENLETLFTFRRHIARNANAQLATEVMMLKLVPKKA
jgi:DNA polymerase-3 subunit delta'